MAKIQPLKIKLSVIILFYHGERWVDSCIQSLENQSLSRDLYEIILVDNGGSTPVIDKYEEHKNIDVYHFPVNYGFAGGNNRALDFATGEIVLLMNQDVVVHYNCLEELLNAFDRYPEAGAISANMFMVSSRDTIDQYESAQKAVGLYRLSSLGYASYFLEETEKDIVPVDFVSGSALGFRKSIIKDVGNYLFDSRLGSYMEDLDLSMRLKKAEWKMYVRPKAVVYHYRDEAFSGKPGYMLGKLIHVSGNRLMVYYNNLAMTDFIKKLPILLLGIPLKVTRWDGDTRFNYFMPMIALMLVPLILVYFGLRVLSNIEAEKERSSISKQAQTDNKKWKWCFQVAMLAFFCGIASLFLYEQDWHSIYSATRLFTWRLLSLLIGLTLLALVVTTLRTKLVFGRIGYSTRFLELFAVSTTGQFSSVMTPGGVGTLLAVPFLKSCFQIPLAYGAIFVTVDRLFGFYLIGCFALTGGLCYFLNQNYAILICFPLLLILAWAFFQILRICDQEIHRFGVPEYGGKMLNHLGTDFLSQLAICISKLFYFSIIISQFLIITRALNCSMDLMSAWMIISVSFFGGIISMIPMGLVSRDASILALSSYAGVPASIGLITIVLMRVVTSIPTAILGTTCGLWLGKRHLRR
jgi:GT2 family glycosyltransferase/uncharacterized membrane protein YbhN (UPF0104 family)